MIRTKRVYDAPSGEDGARVLVDRLWPRGVSKERAKLDLWLKDAAPSDELRKRFHNDPTRWKEFKESYFKELDDRRDALKPLLDMVKKGTVTLLYAAKDERFNNAVALKTYLESKIEE